MTIQQTVAESEAEAVQRVWHEDFKIRSYEIGATGFASPQAVLRFIQEVASNHAAHLKVSVEDLAKEDQMWVLANLSLRMQRYPRWHQRLHIDTWPVMKESAVRGYREMTLFDEHGTEIGKASTLWLLLDKDSRKPQKMPDRLASVAGPAHDPEFITQVKEKDFTGSPQETKDFVIRGSDIDWNLHVNNVSYLEWALETVLPVVRIQNQVSELDISFLAESKYGSSVVAECYAPAAHGQPYMHKILEKDSGKPLALLRVLWQPKVS